MSLNVGAFMKQAMDKSATRSVSSGRPPKFREQRRPITVTLPERILAKLEGVNADRARAIVKCVEAVTSKESPLAKPVELVQVLPGKALVVVGPSRSLAKIPWLRLIEVSPLRHILVFPSGMPVDSMELELLDLIESLDPRLEDELVMLRELRKIISYQRRANSISKGEIVFFSVPK